VDREGGRSSVGWFDGRGAKCGGNALVTCVTSRVTCGQDLAFVCLHRFNPGSVRSEVRDMDTHRPRQPSHVKKMGLGGTEAKLGGPGLHAHGCGVRRCVLRGTRCTYRSVFPAMPSLCPIGLIYSLWRITGFKPLTESICLNKFESLFYSSKVNIEPIRSYRRLPRRLGTPFPHTIHL